MGLYTLAEQKRCNEELKSLKKVYPAKQPSGATNEVKQLAWLTAFHKKMELVNPSTETAWRKLRSMVADNSSMSGLEQHVTMVTKKMSTQPELFQTWTQLISLLYSEILKGQVDSSVDMMMESQKYREDDYLPKMEALNSILKQVNKADPTVRPKTEKELIKYMERSMSTLGEAYSRIIERWTEYYSTISAKCTFQEAVAKCASFKKDTQKVERLRLWDKQQLDKAACSSCGKKHVGKRCPQPSRQWPKPRAAKRKRSRSKSPPARERSPKRRESRRSASKGRKKKRSRSRDRDRKRSRSRDRDRKRHRSSTKTTRSRLTTFNRVVDDMPTYTLTIGGIKVTLYIDTGSELLLVDLDWLRENFPSIYAKRYKGGKWKVKGVGEEEGSQLLVSEYQVQLPFEQIAQVNGVEVTSSLTWNTRLCLSASWENQ